MKPNYSRLRKNLPNKIRTKSRSSYELFWSTDFHFDQADGSKTYGITRYDPKQIVINSNQGDTETIHTVFHEFIHALSGDYEVGLTESQVMKLEKSFMYVREFILTIEGSKKKGKTK